MAEGKSASAEPSMLWRRAGWIGPATWIALETARDEDIAVRTLAVEAERNVGKAKLTILRPE